MSALNEAPPSHQAFEARASEPIVLAQVHTHRSKTHGLFDEVSLVMARKYEQEPRSVEPSSRLVACALPAAGLLVLGSVLVFAILRAYSVEEAENPVCAVVAGVVAHHMEGIVFTYILSDSLAFSHRLGMDAQFSGLLLGVHKMGTAAGSLAMWSAMQANDSFWRSGRLIFQCAVLTQFAGALAFAVAASEIGLVSHASLLTLLLVSRFVAGFGGGILIFLTLTLIGRVVAPEARRAWNVRFFLAGVSGLGTGPLLAAVVRKVQTALGLPAEHLIRSSLAVLPFLPMVQVPSVVYYPNLEGTADLSVRSDSFKMSSLITQSSLVIICVIMQVLRNLTISSLEAGTTMMLETDYKWDSVDTGLTIAAVVGSVLFGNFAYKALADNMSPYAQQHAMNLLMLLGALMICFCRGPWLLLIGVTIAFTASALSGGLIMATLQQHVLPQGYVFDLNKSMLLAVVGADLMGRGGGPILARSVVMWGGKSLFATVQIVLGVGILLLHEVAHRLSAAVEDSGEEQGSEDSSDDPKGSSTET